MSVIFLNRNSLNYSQSSLKLRLSKQFELLRYNRLVFLCGLSAILSGCGNGPDKNTAAQLLMAVEEQNCEVRTFNISGPYVNRMGMEMLGAGSYSPEKVERIQKTDLWIRQRVQDVNNMLPDGGVPNVFVYNDAGHIRRVIYKPLQSAAGIATTGLTLCVYVPTSVNIEDTKVDSSDIKTAVITYTVNKKVSAFGADVMEFLKPEAEDITISGGAISINPMAPRTTLANPNADLGGGLVEHRATLRKLDASGWRVEDVDGSSRDAATPTGPTSLPPYQKRPGSGLTLTAIAAPKVAITPPGSASYLIIGVDKNRLRADVSSSLVEAVRQALQTRQIPFDGLAVQGEAVVVRITDPHRVAEAVAVSRALKIQLASGASLTPTASAKGAVLSLTIDRNAMDELKARSVSEAVPVLQRRVQQMRYSDVSVSRGAGETIRISSEKSYHGRLKYLLQPGRLTASLVDDEARPDDVASGRLPPGEIGTKAYGVGRAFAVKKMNMLPQRVNLSATLAPQNAYSIVEFPPEVMMRLEKVRGLNLERSLVLIMDGNVVAFVPAHSKMDLRRIPLSQAPSYDQISETVAVINSGPLPTYLAVNQERTGK